MVTTPESTPVTMPLVPMVATAVLPLLHTPPLTELLKVVVASSQSTKTPDIVPDTGAGLTVTVCVLCAVPQLLLTE